MPAKARGMTVSGSTAGAHTSCGIVAVVRTVRMRALVCGPKSYFAWIMASRLAAVSFRAVVALPLVLLILLAPIVAGGWWSEDEPADALGRQGDALDGSERYLARR